MGDRRELTREEAVEKALLFTFQLSGKDYRKMQTAMSEVAFIRALEQDGYTVAASQPSPSAVPEADDEIEDARTELLDLLPGSLDQDRDILRATDGLIRAARRRAALPPSAPEDIEGLADALRAGDALVGVLGAAPADCDRQDDLCVMHNAEWSTRNGADLGHCEWIEARMAVVPEWQAARKALAAHVYGRGCKDGCPKRPVKS